MVRGPLFAFFVIIYFCSTDTIRFVPPIRQQGYLFTLWLQPSESADFYLSSFPALFSFFCFFQPNYFGVSKMVPTCYLWRWCSERTLLPTDLQSRTPLIFQFHAVMRDRILRVPKRQSAYGGATITQLFAPWPFCLQWLSTVTLPPVCDQLTPPLIYTTALLTVHVPASSRTSFCPQETPQISMTTGETSASSLIPALCCSLTACLHLSLRNPAVISQISCSAAAACMPYFHLLRMLTHSHGMLWSPSVFKDHWRSLTCLPSFPPVSLCSIGGDAATISTVPVCWHSMCLNVTSVPRGDVCDNQDPTKLYSLQAEESAS